MQKSKALAGLISCCIIMSILLISYNSEPSRASEQDIYVDDDQRYPDEADGSLYNPFYTIQDAMDAAQNGDTIKILPGSYYGDIYIDKSVTITTDDIENTFIYSKQKNAYMIDCDADYVSLEGLQIQDFTITSHRKAVIHIHSNTSGVNIIDSIIDHSENGFGVQIDGQTSSTIVKNNIFNDTKGIIIENSNSVSIHSNHISNCTGSNPALKLVSSDGNHIEENSFSDNLYGIYLQHSSYNYISNNTIFSNSGSGIYINGGTNNDIIDNLIYENANFGIDLGSSYGSVSGNNIYDNYIGITIAGNGNSIFNNIIQNCNYLGLYAKSSSSNNIIYNNNFLDKIGAHALEVGSNKWDNDQTGNYWDDFYGPDPSNFNNTVTYDSDVVPPIYKYTNGGVSDNYPKGIFQKQPLITDPTPANLAEGVDRTPYLSVVVTDPEPDYYKESLDVYFYYIAEGISNLIEARYNVESGGEATIAFTSTIKGQNAVYSYKGLGYGYIGVWYVEVEDSYSRTTSPVWIFSTVEPPANNTKPIVDIQTGGEFVVGDDLYAQINDSILFDASSCIDPDGEIVFYKWSYGDGFATINEKISTHSYKNEGTYIVNLAVIDNDGSSNSANKTVFIGSDYNLPPIAETNGPYTGTVGNSIQFFSSGSKDPNTGDVITYHWDFGDGSNSTEQHPVHMYSNPNKYTVTLTLTDPHGEENTDITEAIINKKTDESPGYEILLVIITILLVSIVLKRKDK